MGNIWERCCSAEDAPHHHASEHVSSKSQPLLTSALRVPSSLPNLQSRADRRKDNIRTVRIDSLSPMIEVDDEYNSDSEDSEASHHGGKGRYSPPLRLSARPPASASQVSPLRQGVKVEASSTTAAPRQSSGLRLLLSNAVSDVEQKDDSADNNGGLSSGLGLNDRKGRGLHRVERHDSLHTVLSSASESSNTVMFASAPLEALKGFDLPKGLLIAFLDDSAVSRLAFQSTLKTFKAAEASFVRGSTVSEAKSFCEEVIAKKPDIVVLDHFLDYEVSPGVFESFKGTQIAREMRDRGYDGCIIMQSDRDCLKDEVDFDVVDGITGRETAHSAIAMARMVAMARRTHKLTGNFAPPVSSTHSSFNSRVGDSLFSIEGEDVDRTKSSEDHEGSEAG